MEVIVFMHDSSDRKGGEKSRERLGQYTQFINRYNILRKADEWGGELFCLTSLRQQTKEKVMHASCVAWTGELTIKISIEFCRMQCD
jgi:hypothetical protein